MKTKYFNDAIIGNKKVLASISKTGELLRLYYPQRDNKQYIDFFETGIKINDTEKWLEYDEIIKRKNSTLTDGTNNN